MRRTVTAAFCAALIGALSLTAGSATGPAFTITKVGSGVSEPGINVSSDGTIYVDGPAGTPGRSKFWRSIDGGASYAPGTFGTVQQRFQGGGDSDIITRGATVYFLDLYLASNSVSVSQDKGATWLTGNPVTTLPASDRQWIAIGDRDAVTGLDTVYALYAHIPGGVSLARSRTGGITWESHFRVPGSSGFTGQLSSDGSKTLSFTAEDGGKLRSFVSTNEGETWRSSEIASDVLSIISGGAQDGQDLYAAWISRGDYQTYVAVSHDLGVTWGSPQQLTTGLTSNIFAWIEARDGKAAVAWYGTDVPSTKPDDVPGDSVWFARYSESIDGGTSWSSPTDVATGYKGFICTQGLACSTTLGGPGHRELGDFLTVTIDNAGKSLVVFGGTTPGGIRVAKQN